MRFVDNFFDPSKATAEHVYRQHTFEDLEGQPHVLVHESVGDGELLARYAEAVAAERDELCGRAVAMLEDFRRMREVARELQEIAVQCGGEIR